MNDRRPGSYRALAVELLTGAFPDDRPERIVEDARLMWQRLRPTPARVEARPVGAPIRVLVAEDEALIRLDLVEMLHEEGYEVVGQASDGQTAVHLAETLHPDLVIVDIKMPILDGLAAAEAITAARIAPVVVLTGFSQRTLVERARAAGAMAYLVKPFSRSDLTAAAEIALSRHAEITAMEAEVASLRERLETRRMVERAKAHLMEATAMTEVQAFTLIQRMAMNYHLPLRNAAERILAEDRPSDRSDPGGDDPSFINPAAGI